MCITHVTRCAIRPKIGHFFVVCKADLTIVLKWISVVVP